MAGNRKYHLACCRWIWGISLFLFISALAVMWFTWPTIMRYGEPGIDSTMLLEDCQQISNSFRKCVITGYAFLGFFVVFGYIGYWFCHYIPSPEPRLRKTAKEYRRSFIGSYLSLAFGYVQQTFTVKESLAIWYNWGMKCAVWLSAVWALFYLIKALKNGRIRIREEEKRIKDSAEKIRGSSSLYRVFVSTGYIVSIFGNIVNPVFEFIQHLGYWQLPTPFMNVLFVKQPFVLVTIYDFMMALMLPLVLLILLELNLRFNAPPKIGVPYLYAAKGIHIFTCATSTERKKAMV